MRSFLLALVCLLPVLALPAAAAPASASPRPSNLRSDILYTHRGEFVQVSPMRPLTLNAHVEQFAYDPQGLEIACVGSEPQGDDTLHFVKTVDAHTGKEISRLTLTAPADSQNASFRLLGWSVSGKYLLIQRFSPDPNEPNTAVAEFLRWNLSADPPATRTIDLAGTLPQGSIADKDDSGYGFPSPDGRWVAFRQEFREQNASGEPGHQQTVYLLYDVEQDTLKPLMLPPDVSVYSWTDNTHLKFWQLTQRKQLDVVTGEVSPLSDDKKLDPPPASKQYPDLTLDTEQRDLDDLKEGSGHAPTCIVWIRRTPFGSVPLGSAAAAVMPSRPQVNAPWENDPQAAWSPTGKQVAFIANDNLYVTDLVAATDLLPHEKMAVGLKLSCEEEQQLALSDLKTIGLGIIQYCQDFDEHYPASGGFLKTIYPYIKSMDVFQADGHPFVYEKPAISLAQVDSPATTENGYMDLPCARIVLFCDGHVKVFPKQEAAP